MNFGVFIWQIRGEILVWQVCCHEWSRFRDLFWQLCLFVHLFIFVHYECHTHGIYTTESKNLVKVIRMWNSQTALLLLLFFSLELSFQWTLQMVRSCAACFLMFLGNTWDCLADFSIRKTGNKNNAIIRYQMHYFVMYFYHIFLQSTL